MLESLASTVIVGMRRPQHVIANAHSECCQVLNRQFFDRVCEL
jgi:hypothetical protein